MTAIRLIFVYLFLHVIPLSFYMGLVFVYEMVLVSKIESEVGMWLQESDTGSRETAKASMAHNTHLRVPTNAGVCRETYLPFARPAEGVFSLLEVEG